MVRKAVGSDRYVIEREPKRQPSEAAANLESTPEQHLPCEDATAAELFPVMSTAQRSWREALRQAAVAHELKRHSESGDGQAACALESTGRRCLLVSCAETDTYRRIARAEALSGDVCLEIGSDLGLTTALLAAGAGEAAVLGVDLSTDSVRKAREAFPKIRFERLDMLQPAAAATLHCWRRECCVRLGVESRGTAAADAVSAACEQAFDKVFVDVNGNRGLDSVLQIVGVVVQELRAPFVCVKSRELHRALSDVRTRQRDGVGSDTS